MAPKKGHIPWNKGIKTKPNPNAGFKKGMVPWNKGKKGAYSIRHSGQFKKGQSAWNKGLKMGVSLFKGKLRPESFRIKMRTASSFYKGGKTPEAKRIKMSIEWKLWRAAVFVRDDYTCQHCGKHSGNGSGVVLHPHHILSFAEYPEHRFNIANGLTLCKECHHKTDNYGSKQYSEKRDEFGGTPERTIPSQAEKSEGVTVRGAIIPISIPHSEMNDDMTWTTKELVEVGNRKPTIT
jgi:5-methylcytosine-specific restriction endonuclease McrA